MYVYIYIYTHMVVRYLLHQWVPGMASDPGISTCYWSTAPAAACVISVPANPTAASPRSAGSQSPHGVRGVFHGR